MPYLIEDMARVMREAASRGDIDRAQVEATVERWKAASKAHDEAWAGSRTPQQVEKIEATLVELNASTKEVTDLYLSVT